MTLGPAADTEVRCAKEGLRNLVGKPYLRGILGHAEMNVLSTPSLLLEACSRGGRPSNPWISRHVHYRQSGYKAMRSRPRKKIGLCVRPPCRLIQLRIGAG
jgi:hypothetical protein